MLINNSDNRIVPDGGWGWMVVLGVALMQAFSESIIHMFSVIYGQKIEIYKINTSTSAFILDSSLVISNLVGLICAPIIKKFSYRQVAVTGCLLISFGIILSSQAYNLITFFVTYSIFSGVGLGLAHVSTFLAINSYFKKYNKIAVSLSLLGHSLGGVIMPQVISKLVDNFTSQMSIVIVGLITLVGVIGGLLFRPVEFYTNPKSDSEEIIENENNQNECTNETHLSLWKNFLKSLDLKLLKNLIYVNVAIGVSMAFSGNTYFNMLFPLFLNHGAHLDKDKRLNCVSLENFVGIFARLTIPFFATAFKWTSRFTYFICLCLVALIRVVLAFETSYLNLLIVSGLLSYFESGTEINLNLSIAESVTPEKLPAALGLQMVIKGILILTIGQILGFIRDYFNDYKLGMITTSFAPFLVVLLWSVEFFVIKIKNMRNSSRKSTQL